MKKKTRKGTAVTPEPLAYSIDEVAPMVKLCSKTVRRLVKLRELTSRRIGSRILIPRSAIEAFLRRDHPTR